MQKRRKSWYRFDHPQWMAEIEKKIQSEIDPDLYIAYHRHYARYEVWHGPDHLSTPYHVVNIQGPDGEFIPHVEITHSVVRNLIVARDLELVDSPRNWHRGMMQRNDERDAKNDARLHDIYKHAFRQERRRLAGAPHVAVPDNIGRSK